MTLCWEGKYEHTILTPQFYAAPLLVPCKVSGILSTEMHTWPKKGEVKQFLSEWADRGSRSMLSSRKLTSITDQHGLKNLPGPPMTPTLMVYYFYQKVPEAQQTLLTILGKQPIILRLDDLLLTGATLMTCPAENRHFAKSSSCVLFGDNSQFCFQQEPVRITFACWRTATECT